MKLDKSLEPFRAAIESLQRLLHKFNDRGVAKIEHGMVERIGKRTAWRIGYSHADAQALIFALARYSA
jgi:hypothetical protein